MRNEEHKKGTWKTKLKEHKKIKNKKQKIKIIKL